MLDAILPNIVVPHDRLARVKQVIPMGEGAQRHRGFLAQEVKFGVVGYFPNKSPAGKQKAPGKESRTQRTIGVIANLGWPSASYAEYHLG